MEQLFLMKNKQGLLDYSGLLFECPLTEELDTCIFKNIRKMNLKDRVEMWRNLSDQDRNQYINAHHVCIYQREHHSFDPVNLLQKENKLQ